jgi:SAM-dependent methyltransferase
VGTRYSPFSHRKFSFDRCLKCRFTFVSNPRTDFDVLYDEDYYSGRGADPAVDYIGEVENPRRTIRRYEWRGIIEIVSGLTDLGPATRWLDYGCGTGGLVRYAHAYGIPGAIGFEEGWNSKRLSDRGIPHLTPQSIDSTAGAFDVITAIEVLEHLVDPIHELTRIRRLLKPGGVLFVTTGNARPHRDRFLDWSYVVPDVHVSYFDPDNLALAMKKAGLAPSFPGYVAGWDNVIRFKVLKNLRPLWLRKLERVVPWAIAARIVDRRLGVSAHPVGRTQS